MNEVAVVRILLQNPRYTQKRIAAEIGKSERTVKAITTHLVEKGIIRRMNGKRDGYWEVLTQD